MKKPHIAKSFWIICLAVLIVAALLAFLDRSGQLFKGWIAYTVLLGVGAAGIYGTWKTVSASRNATLVSLIAFAVRLVIGVTLSLVLPIAGYQDNQEHQAGYVYTDAYTRDNQAWNLAISGQPLTTAFSGVMPGDQYGGMLALSAFVYRYLSPDAHRPFLILILGAIASSLGVLCLWKATQAWYGEKVALLAAWFFALYPESVLLGSSQMREAIVIPLLALPFYGLTRLQVHKLSGWLWIIISAIILIPIQPLVSIISYAVLAGLWLFDPATMSGILKRQTLLAVAALLALVLVAGFTASSILANLPSLEGKGPLSIYLTWFQNNFAYQSYILERASGMLQGLLRSVGEQWRWLIILVYGTAQPVLPATVGDPSAAWIMRLIGFLRAAGWYALALFLIYGALSLIRSRISERRLQLGWISLVSFAWIIVSALNAGADQWDNPRYRAILLIWQVILAAWALEYARLRHDAWLWRWLSVEVVFVGLFTEWYLARYYPGFIHVDIKIMSLITLVICGMILAGGYIWDRRHKVKPITPKSGL